MVHLHRMHITMHRMEMGITNRDIVAEDTKDSVSRIIRKDNGRESLNIIISNVDTRDITKDRDTDSKTVTTTMVDTRSSMTATIRDTTIGDITIVVTMDEV